MSEFYSKNVRELGSQVPNFLHVWSFVWCLGYADDLMLRSASRSGLQLTVDLCQKFTVKKSVMFRTNSELGALFSQRNRVILEMLLQVS